jgi:DDE superfamily endonuclease
MNKDMLDLYSDYLIAQNQYATATGLSDLLEGRISHDKVTRFLNNKAASSKELWAYVKPEIRKIEQDSSGVLILDDMIEEKTYTDENELICWHYSHVKGRYVKGVNILSCLVRYGDIALPIAFEPICKEVLFSDVATRKLVRRSSISKNEMFRSMIAQAAKNEVMFDYILADNWFGAKKNMEFIHYDMNKKFILGIKANRLVALSEEERKNGQYQNLNTLPLKDGEKRVVWLKDMPFPVALITKIFKNEDNSTGTLYLVTNDLENGADRIYEVYQKRWRIEEYHKSIKQNTSLEKSPTKVVRSQRNHIFASIIAYCKLEFLKMKTCLNHFALKYQLLMKANRQAFLELERLRFNTGCDRIGVTFA